MPFLMAGILQFNSILKRMLKRQNTIQGHFCRKLYFNAWLFATYNNLESCLCCAFFMKYNGSNLSTLKKKRANYGDLGHAYALKMAMQRGITMVLNVAEKNDAAKEISRVLSSGRSHRVCILSYRLRPVREIRQIISLHLLSIFPNGSRSCSMSSY